MKKEQNAKGKVKKTKNKNKVKKTSQYLNSLDFRASQVYHIRTKNRFSIRKITN